MITLAIYIGIFTIALLVLYKGKYIPSTAVTILANICEYAMVALYIIWFMMWYSSPLPHNALIGGYTEEGFPVYVGRELPGQDACSYIPSSNRTILGFSKAKENMGLLVVL